MALKIYDTMTPVSEFMAVLSEYVGYSNDSDGSLETAKDALDKLFSSAGFSLDYDSSSGELTLKNVNGTLVGDTVTISSGGSGSSGSGSASFTLDVIAETDEASGESEYYLIAYTTDGNEICRTVLPATGGSSSTYLIRVINLMSSLTYSVAASQTHVIKMLYLEMLGTENTGVAGRVEVAYKLSSADEYTTIGSYDIACASSTTDTNNAFSFDATNYLTAGDTTNFQFTITGGESQQTKTVTYTITSVEMSITTTTSFDSAFTGNFSFLYRTLGRGLSKTVYIIIDGVEYAVIDVGTSHNTQLSYTINLISDFEYGAHDFQAYFITSDGAQSNILHYTILYDDGSSEEPMIGAVLEDDTITYGETITVNYVVYTPNQETTDSVTINLYDDEGVSWSSAILNDVTNAVTQTWTCDNYPTSGTIYIDFTSGNSTVTLTATIESSSYDVTIETTTTNLVFSFNPSGKSNNDVDKETISYDYTDVNNVSTTISCDLENFNWVSDGYTSTDYGTALRLASDDVMTINVPIFSSSYTDDNGQTIRFHGTPTGIGRTIEITLNMHEVVDRNATVLTCMSDGHAGIIITPQTAYLLSATGSDIETDETGFVENEESICCAYVKDEKKLRITFVISAGIDDNKQCLFIYINGEVAKSFPYDNTENFIQTLPITIGTPSCITDIYDIKIYDRELSEDEIKTNYYASQSTIAERISIYEDNDVLDDNGDISYEKCILKYACLLCVGDLSPYKGYKTKVGWRLTKPDGEGGYTVEFDCRDQIDGAYVGQCNVQGTSSVKFIRKNYKVYPVDVIDNGDGTYSTKKHKYDIKDGGGGVKVSTLCWKADYMSSDHANTFNANLAEMITRENAPSEVQTDDSSIQTCINGFRCILFHDDGTTVEFAGDGTLNNDKSNSSAFGYENDGDLPEDETGKIISNYTKVQRYEFLNNTADLCHFKVDNFQHVSEGSDSADVYEAFESTYPDQGDLEDVGLEPNWDYFQVVVSWIAQRANFWDADDTTIISKTYNGTTYTTERAYRKAIFYNEFTKHINLDRALIYYLFLEFVALVDNRAKNMFFTSFDTTVEQLYDTSGNAISINDCIDEDGNVNVDMIDWTDKSTFAIWEPTLYDLDSCYSAENNGYLRVPYYADWDYELKGTKQFNGYESRLWLPFEEAFATEIKAKAQTLASNELMCYDTFYNAHIVENAENMCCTIVNYDMEYKYDEPWVTGYYDYSTSTTDPTWLTTSMYKYLHRGQRTEQKQSYIYNRSHMWYSKYQTTQFTNNNINFRVGASDGITADKADITLTASIALYLACKYGDSSASAVTNGKIMPNTPTTLSASNGVGRSDTVYLYSGSDLTDIGDVSIFEPYEVQLQNAGKLKNLVLGNKSITNTSLSSLDTSSCKLLQLLKIEGCTALTGTLNISSNGLIEEVYASGSGVTYMILPTGGNLTVLELPSVRTLVVQNHTKLEQFSCDSYSNLIQLRIENTPNIPTDEMVLNYLSQFTNGLRLVGVEWELDDSELLELLVSSEATGKYLTSAGTLSEDSSAYPYISGTVTIEKINQSLLNSLNTAYPYLTINYTTLTHTVTFYDGDGNVFNVQEIDHGYPANTPVGTPTKSPTTQYTYTFVNYDTSYTRVTEDLSVNANFSRTIQTYTVNFYQYDTDTNALYTLTGVEYGSSVEYEGDNPSVSDAICIGWVDGNGNVYESNIVTLTDECCEIDEDGNTLPISFYVEYQTVKMPTTSVATPSLMTYSEIKAVSNRISAGDGDDWTVTYNESDNQYILQNTASGITVTLTVGDELDVELSNGTTETWLIYDFNHDVDADGNTVGITFGMRDLYSGESETDSTNGYWYRHNMNPSYKQCYSYTIDGTEYVNDNGNYSTSDDTSTSTKITPTSSEVSRGYVEMTITDRTFLRSIVVTDSGGTNTTWHFDYRGYYSGDDVTSMTTPSWYISDFTQNTYKVGKAMYNAIGSCTDGATLSGKDVTPSGFGDLEIDATDGQLKLWVDTSAWNNYAVYSEFTGTVILRIPISSDETITINHWTYSRNVGGYERTTMREWLTTDFWNLLPLGLQNVITAVAKNTTIGNRSTDYVTTVDKIWLFSAFEVGTVTSGAGYSSEGTLYPIFSNAESRKKYYQQGAGVVFLWWLRSPYIYISGGTNIFLNVNTSGGYGNSWAYYTYGVVAGFGI